MAARATNHDLSSSGNSGRQLGVPRCRVHHSTRASSVARPRETPLPPYFRGPPTHCSRSWTWRPSGVHHAITGINSSQTPPLGATPWGYKMNDADLDAARLLLARMGITPEQLLKTQHTAKTHMPTFGEYISQVSDAVPSGTRRSYQTYWQRIIDTWGDRRLDEPTPLEIKKLCESVKACAITRKNSRGGRSATEHLIAALRCLYRHAA